MSQPTLVSSINITHGDWAQYSGSYDHINTDVTNTYYEYELSFSSGTASYNIGYNWTTGKWFDTHQTNHHNYFGTSASNTNASARESSQDPTFVYVMEDSTPRYVAGFSNPYNGTYSSGGSSTMSTSTVIQIYRDLASSNRVIAFMGGGNASQGQLYISDATGPRTVGVSHQNGTDTTIYWSPISTGTYEFVRSTGTGYVPLSTMTVDMSETWPPGNTIKKAFCNFW